MMAVVDADLPASGLEALFRAHHHGLVRLAMVLIGDPGRAEELAQEAFVRFDPSRVRPGAELPYLRRTVVNLSHSHHRHLRVVRAAPPDLGYVTEAPAGPAELSEQSARHRQVMVAIRRLPERQRDCVVLHYFCELSDVEVAAVLGVASGSVKTHLHRARATLAHELEAWQ
jgi:RNA polymerase sigma factor (sigma-70 family)